MAHKEHYYTDQVTSKVGFTTREIELLNQCKQVMPKPFLLEYANDDLKLLSFIQTVCGDINYTPPLTGYLVNSIPNFFDTIIVLGTQFYAQLFLAMKWSMNDFTYNEGGISINFDRVGKLTATSKMFAELYQKKTADVKKNQFNYLVLGTNRYNAQLATFIRLAVS